jgi:integrase
MSEFHYIDFSLSNTLTLEFGMSENKKVYKELGIFLFMKLGRFDGDISYIGTVGFLFQKYDKLLKKWEKEGNLKYREWILWFYTIVALIQIKNGTRSCEAVKGFYRFVQEKKTEIEMKACKNGNIITLLKPNLVPLHIMEEIWKNISQPYLKKGYDIDKILYRLRRNYQQYIEDHKDWKEVLSNTHSLRYAFIKHMTEKGISSAELSIMLGHKKVDTTFYYQQVYNAFRKKKELTRDI